MTDVDDLRRLSAGYAAAVDALDGDAFADLFTTDGELWVPDAALGAEPTIRRAGAEQLRRIPMGLGRYHSTSHQIVESSYEVHGSTAVGTVTGEAHHLTASSEAAAGGEDGGPGVDTIWHLRYEDEYCRVTEGWRIAKRALHLLSIEERSVDQLGPGR